MNLKSILTILIGSMLLFAAACKKDPCKDISCQNGGACVEGDCECPPGFEGTFCEFIDVSDFLGTYAVEYEGCFSTSPSHKVGIAASNESGFNLIFLDLGDYECPGDDRIKVQAKAEPSGISIPEQVLCADGNFAGYTYSGSGTREADTIRLGFKVVYEADGLPRTDSCRAKLVRER